MKVFKNTIVKGYDGKPIQLPIFEDGKTEVKEANLVNILYFILNNTLLRTMKDSIEGVRLVLALDKAKNNTGSDIEIEEGTHDWLKDAIKAEQLLQDNTKVVLIVQLFRLNAKCVSNLICEGFEKSNQ